MKLAFSTLGMPGAPVAEAVRLAAAHGYRGVELRVHPEEQVHLGLSAAERARVARRFAAAGVEVLGLAGYARAAAEGDDAAVVAELTGLVELARDLGAPHVRVFPGGGRDRAAADAAAVRRLSAAAPAAGRAGVDLLLETHDSHRAGVDAARVAAAVGHPRVGVIWDVLHTWLAGERPAASHAALAPHLGYVQVKDVASAADLTPLALGSGVLPLAECLAPLAPGTWVCWEYEKRWHPGAAELPGLLDAGRAHLLRAAARAGSRPSGAGPRRGRPSGARGGGARHRR